MKLFWGNCLSLTAKGRESTSGSAVVRYSIEKRLQGFGVSLCFGLPLILFLHFDSIVGLGRPYSSFMSAAVTE